MKSPNFLTSIVQQLFTAADTETPVAHGLCAMNGTPMTPRGVIAIRRNGAASIYISGTQWTNTIAYLKCNLAAVQFTLMFF